MERKRKKTKEPTGQEMRLAKEGRIPSKSYKRFDEKGSLLPLKERLANRAKAGFGTPGTPILKSVKKVDNYAKKSKE